MGRPQDIIVERDSRPRSGTTRRTALLACMGALAWCVYLPALMAQAAEDSNLLEDRVKAAFLYKFISYVEWPEASFSQPDTPITIAVAGSEAVAAELSQAVLGRAVNNRSITVKNLKPGDTLAGVHILFIGKNENARLGDLLQSAQRRFILTVTESEGALKQGSVINFVLTERKVRFEISLESAEKSKLRLSSRLLAVAQQVRTGAP